MKNMITIMKMRYINGSIPSLNIIKLIFKINPRLVSGFLSILYRNKNNNKKEFLEMSRGVEV